MTPRPLALTLVAATFAARLPAQRIESSLDLSGTNVWYADSIRSGGASLNPSLRIDWPRATLSGAASISRLAGAGASAQGALVPSFFSPSVGPFAAELTGTLGGSTHADGSRTGQAIGLARAYAMTSDGSLGSWLGGGVGRTWDGAVWRDVRQGDIGAWFEHSGVTTLATVAPVVVEDTIRYTDVQAALRYPIGIYEVGATGGVRAGVVGAAVGGSSRAWASVSVVAWVRSGLAIVASGGSYPVDFTQGYPGGHFVSVAMRIASGEGAAHSRAKEAPPGTSNATSSAPTALAFELREARSGRELRVYAPAAHSVEIEGDFTRWEPLALDRGQDGWWSAVRPMSSGSYQVNLRVDGGAWIAPPGLLAMQDEFGGIVGILTIP
jgi:predicted carbohydrate-binding protein with CBM48